MKFYKCVGLEESRSIKTRKIRKGEKMKKAVMILSLLAITTFVDATPLKSDGWNLMSACVDINKEDINMTGITQIQSQDGKFIYTGEFESWTNLDMLQAGYGYWVQGDTGTLFDSGDATTKVTVPLIHTGWNLVGMCQDTNATDINMSAYEQIQSQDGKFIFTGEYADWSNLDVLDSGYGYWVNANAGTTWIAKPIVTLPIGYTFAVINNQGEPQEATVDGYRVKLLANYAEVEDRQQNHKGVKVQLNGGTLSELLEIQVTYAGSNIIVAVYNYDDELVAVSELIAVTADTTPLQINVNLDTDGNHAPILNPIGSQVVDSNGSDIVLDLNATDADGDTLSFSVTSSDVAKATVNLSGNQLTITPLVFDNSTVPITVTVSDGKAIDSETFNVTLTGSSSLELPAGYDYRAINNSGTEVETTIDINGVTYTVKLYADYVESANDQANHTGIVVKVNGENAPTMQIQETYRTKNIVAGIYSPAGELVAISNIVAVDASAPVTILDGAVIN